MRLLRFLLEQLHLCPDISPVSDNTKIMKYMCSKFHIFRQSCHLSLNQIHKYLSKFLGESVVPVFGRDKYEILSMSAFQKHHLRRQKLHLFIIKVLTSSMESIILDNWTSFRSLRVRALQQHAMEKNVVFRDKVVVRSIKPVKSPLAQVFTCSSVLTSSRSP